MFKTNFSTMKNTEDEIEKMTLSAEPEPEEDERSKKYGEELEEDQGAKQEDGGDDKDEKLEAELQVKDGKVTPPAKGKDKKESDVLNLNNEVVKLRKEVKRVRALTIRKLTRQIVNLKKKKGKEAEVEKNQRRAARLLEELHAMKDLVPDIVTKTALQKNLNFEQVCKNPKSTISDRATARIATHPQFNTKIQAIKAAVKAFKDERRKGRKLVDRERLQPEPAKAPQQPTDKTSEREIIGAKPQKAAEPKVGVKVIKDGDDATVSQTEEKVCSEAPAAAPIHTTPEYTSEEHTVVKTCNVENTGSTHLQSRDAQKPLIPNPATTEPQRTTDNEESDLESSGDEEEKEYFDDSTEERFHKQSSQSEESDAEDDFFLGKVSKFKKKKMKVEGEELKEEVKKGSEQQSDKLESELDELESRLKPKGKAFQSVFCPSLSGAKAGRGGGPARGRARGRGGGRFRGSKGGSGPSRGFSQQSRYQRESESSSVSKDTKAGPEAGRGESGEKSYTSAGRGRGRGRGRGDNFRQNGPHGFSHQTPQQALHPSWEASKKRKEQQGQILAFKGKKIKFDDDD